MSGFDEIVTVFSRADEVPEGLPLVVALSGFSDAGQLVPQLDSALLENGDDGSVSVIARFNRDLLYDYRARRPISRFDGIRVVEVDMPELEISLVQPADGQAFLYLHGFEPDFRWEAVILSVEEFIAEFGVSSVTTFHSIPMPVPHTRPVQSTVAGNREDLQERWSVWKPHTQIPSSILHVIENRVIDDTDGEIPVAGFVMLVPHYLAESEFPSVLTAALERLESATGLSIDEEGLSEREAEFAAKVTEQIDDSAELAALVDNLETRFDEYMAGIAEEHHFNVDLENLPTADEIAAEFESFLAAQAKKDNDGDKA